jgi:FkbM family methyltransferase
VFPLLKKGYQTKAETFFGTTMTLVLPSATEIYLFGAKTHNSEIRLARYLIKTLKPTDIVVDVGAHFGYYTLLSAALIGEKGRVFAFEPSEIAYQVLQENVKNLPFIKTINAALSDSFGTKLFNEFPVLFSEHNSLYTKDIFDENVSFIQGAKRKEISTFRLDDFLASENVLPALVKIDVEGSELEVLIGMERLWTIHKPVIVMEYHPDSQRHQEALDFAMKAGGYRWLEIQSDGSLEAATAGTLPQLTIDSDNLVLIAD